MTQFNNGDKVRYRLGLKYLYIGVNPLKKEESYCVHPSTNEAVSLLTEDLTLFYEGVTKEELKELTKYVYKFQPKKRKFKFYSGCDERGWVNTEIFSHCGNNECIGCNQMQQALKDEIKKQTNGTR